MAISNDLKKKFLEAKKLFENSQRVLLVSHEYTDGDDLGAMLSLGRVLAETFQKPVYLLAKGNVPDNLLFLPGQAEIQETLPILESYEVLVTLGCGELSRTGYPELLEWKKPIVNIDHHPDTKMFGTINICDERMAATSELMYLMLKEWGAQIDKYIAMNLLTGVFTDTGGFRHTNVSALTFEIAAELLRRGAKLDLISRFTSSQKDLPKLRAWALALENARFDPNQKMVYTVITAEDLTKAQAREEDLDGVVELLNTIPDAKFSMVLKQRGDEIKGSLRSETYKGVDVSEIARAFGGGGHKHAAGFKFRGKIEKTEEGWRIT